MTRRFQIEIKEETFQQVAARARAENRPLKMQIAWELEQNGHSTNQSPTPPPGAPPRESS